MATFDRFARSYDEDLSAGLRITGEDKDFFARASPLAGAAAGGVDRDGVLLTARQAVRLLDGAGLQPLAFDHTFIFPRALKVLRPLEPWLVGWPVGGQYQVLARR
jgi:hypothetical protein